MEKSGKNWGKTKLQIQGACLIEDKEQNVYNGSIRDQNIRRKIIRRKNVRIK